jgi:hypothetical protein
MYHPDPLMDSDYVWRWVGPSGLGFFLNKTPSPSPTGLKIGQSLMGLKIKPFMPEGLKFFLYAFVVNFLYFLQIFRPVLRAQFLKALSPILNFKSPKKPEPEGFNPSPKKSGPTHL